MIDEWKDTADDAWVSTDDDVWLAPSWLWGDEAGGGESNIDGWDEWSDGSGGAASTTGGAAWGALDLALGEEAFGPVVDFGVVGYWELTITYDEYDTGAGNHQLFFRWSKVSFGQNDPVGVGPAWELYSAAAIRECRFVQVKAMGGEGA